MEIAGKALTHFGASKTYTLLILLALLALFTCIIAAAAFGQHLWDRLFDLFLGETAAGGARAVAVDGAPKIAASWRDPNSHGANPPSAMQPPPTYEPTPPVHAAPPAISMPIATPRYSSPAN